VRPSAGGLAWGVMRAWSPEGRGGVFLSFLPTQLRSTIPRALSAAPPAFRSTNPTGHRHPSTHGGPEPDGTHLRFDPPLNAECACNAEPLLRVRHHLFGPSPLSFGQSLR
jgi:hypothetical protein